MKRILLTVKTDKSLETFWIKQHGMSIFKKNHEKYVGSLLRCIADMVVHYVVDLPMRDEDKRELFQHITEHMNKDFETQMGGQNQ